MKKNKSSSVVTENLSMEEEYEEAGFCDAPAGTTVAQFNFQDDEASDSEDSSESFVFNSSQDITDTRRLKSKPNGKTPAVDGESFDINRTFTLRKSTVRHLNELKAAHPDINVYLNTIVDKALNHYYDYIFNKNGTQD